MTTAHVQLLALLCTSALLIAKTCCVHYFPLGLPFYTVDTRSPTVTQLQEEGWFAVQALIERKRSADIMDQLAEVQHFTSKTAHSLLVLLLSELCLFC
jgi:HisG, C-terminal domain